MPDRVPPTRLDSGAEPTPAQRIVAECVVALERGDAAAADAILRQHPEIEPLAREHLAALRRAGLVGAASDAGEAPAAIGPYRILEAIGRGGMGAVYLAEQREPVRRRVAIKLIKRGMDSQEVVARFAAERQALALMNHPNIAKVLDAGTAADGLPFFVMEYVAGLPITTYCDRHAFSTEQRLHLFLDVCEGVQHAHSKGIIHRDLKASNVLVAEQDGKPTAKIIDFGVAKAIGHRLTDVTLHTLHGMVIGTPEYMSPEQAGRDALDIDTRSDVYSLGVLLYELLTGALPFAPERLRTDYAEMQRILREEEPATPSKRVSTLATTMPALVQARAASTQALQRRLRGDLDWICLKALEKDRDRRYATANDFAADVRRHLAHEPVVAGPPSTAYRMRKFVLRNRVQVAAAALVALALVGGLGASLYFATDARAALVRESTARDAAEANFDSALEAVDALLTRIAAERLDAEPRMEQVRRDLLQEAARFYRRFLAERAGDRRARLQAARAQKALARVSSMLDDLAGAKAAARAAVAELGALAAAEPALASLRIELADAYDVEATVCDRAGETARAQAAFAAAAAAVEAVHAARPADLSVRSRLATALHNRGYFLRDREPAVALALFQSAIAHMEAVVAAEPSAARRRLLVELRSGLAAMLLRQGDVQAAERDLSAARERLDALTREHPADPKLRELQADIWRKLAGVYFTTGRLPQARDAARAEVAIQESLVADFARVPSHRRALSNALGNLGILLTDLGEPGADDAFRRCVGELDKLVGEFPAVVEYQVALANYAGNLSLALYRGGRRAALVEAEALARRSVSLCEARSRADPDNIDIASRLLSMLGQLGTILSAAGRPGEATACVDRAVALAGDLAARQPEHLQVQHDLADVLLARGLLRLAAGDRAGTRMALDAGLAAIAQARRLSKDSGPVRATQANLQRLQGFWLARGGDCAAASAAVDELLTLFEDKGMGSFAAAEVLASAWRTAGQAGDRAGNAQASRCAERARRLYEEAILAFGGNLASNPGDEYARVLQARARVGRATLGAGEADVATAELEQALRVVETEYCEGHVDRDVSEALAEGLALLAERCLAAAEADAAARACDKLESSFPDDPERQFRAACLRARCAGAVPGDAGRRRGHLDAAAAALQRAFACGFRDVARARSTADLADVLARPEIESLLR